MSDSSERTPSVKALWFGCEFCKRRGYWVQYHRSDGHWHITCRTCDPLPDGASYWWRTADMRTRVDVERWIDQVSGKRWIVETDWLLMEAHLRRVAGL